MGAIAGVLLLVASAQPSAGDVALESLGGAAAGLVGTLALGAAASAGQDCSEGCTGLFVALLAYPFLIGGGIAGAGYALGRHGSYLAALGGTVAGGLLTIGLAAALPPLGFLMLVVPPILGAVGYELSAGDAPVRIAPLAGRSRGVALSFRF